MEVHDPESPGGAGPSPNGAHQGSPLWDSGLVCRGGQDLGSGNVLNDNYVYLTTSGNF